MEVNSIAKEIVIFYDIYFVLLWSSGGNCSSFYGDIAIYFVDYKRMLCTLSKFLCFLPHFWINFHLVFFWTSYVDVGTIYLGLAYPIFHKTSVTKRRLITFLLATQTCALILDIITSNFRVSKIEQPYTIIFVSAFVILVIALNCKMFYIAKSRHNISSNGGKKFFQFKKYHTCLLAAILFFLTCCPIFVYYGLVFLNMLDKKSDIAVCLFFWASTVVTMNSTANAVIFFWINNVLRSEGKKLVKKLCPSLCMFW